MATIDPKLYDTAGSIYDVDPGLLRAVAIVENGQRTTAPPNAAGAAGAMQFIPETAARYGIQDPEDPTQSVFGAAAYLRDLINNHNGDVAAALQDYNGAGSDRTQAYAKRVFANYQPLTPPSGKAGTASAASSAPPTPSTTAASSTSPTATPQSATDRFLATPDVPAAPAAAPAQPPQSATDRFLATPDTPPPTTPATSGTVSPVPSGPPAPGTPVPPAPATSLKSGDIDPVTGQKVQTLSAGPAPSLATRIGDVITEYTPPNLSSFLAGVNRGMGTVGSVADAADAWLYRHVPGVASAEEAVNRLTGGAVRTGPNALAQQQATNTVLDAGNAGSIPYAGGKFAGETVATAPIAGPIGEAVGAVGGRIVGPIADAAAARTAARGATAAVGPGGIVDPAAVEAANVAAAGQRAAITRLGIATGTGAGGGAAFNAMTGGPNEDPTSNPFTNAGKGALGGGIFGFGGSAVASGARTLLGGVGSAVESMADRLGIPLSHGERIGGIAKSLEDASAGLPFSGAAKLAAQKNAATAGVLADKMGIPGGPVANITTPMLNAAEDRAGQRIEDAATKIDAPFDQTMLDRVTEIQRQAGLQGADTKHYNAAVQMGDQLFNTAANNNGVIPGADFARFLKRGGDLDSLINSGNPDVANVGRQLKDELMAAGGRSSSASAQAIQDLQLGRQQWKAIQTVRPVIDRTAAGSEEMSPQRLATAIRNNYDMSYTGAGNEMQDLARVIDATKPLPSSGTAERLQRMRLWSSVPGALMGAAGLGGFGSYLYDPALLEGNAQSAAAFLPLLMAGRFSRLGLPGGAAALPRYWSGQVGNKLIAGPPKNQLLPAPAP